MKINNYRRLMEQQSAPFTQDDVNAMPCFVRCIRETATQPGPVANSVYLVRSVTEGSGDNQKRWFYKIDGLASGVKLEKILPSLNFTRWYPKIGDLLFIMEEKEPLLCTKIDIDRNSGRPTFMCHKHDSGSREWRHHNSYIDPEVTPALGLHLDKDVAQAFAQVLNPLLTVVTDTTFGYHAVPSAASPNAAPTAVPPVMVMDDASRSARLTNMQKQYSDSLQVALALAKQYQAHTSAMLPGHEALQVLVNSLALVSTTAGK